MYVYLRKNAQRQATKKLNYKSKYEWMSEAQSSADGRVLLE